MIASLRGRLVAKDAEGVVVECGGVGYGVAMSVTGLAKLGDEGSDVFLLVHTHLTQDALRLYGFVDADEREVFEVLINTSGVGPRLALAILSTLAPGELVDVVAQGDKGMLTRIPGVGAKKAERLLVELKGRLTLPSQAPSASTPAELEADLLSALENLGFKQKEAEVVARQALEGNPGERDLTVLVRDALRASTKL